MCDFVVLLCFGVKCVSCSDTAALVHYHISLAAFHILGQVARNTVNIVDSEYSIRYNAHTVWT